MNYTASWSNKFEVKTGRWVYNPTEESRIQGKQIVDALSSRWKKPSNYYHLRDGGHVAALQRHMEHKYFATLDLNDFFGSISRSRVTRSLKKIVGYDDARKIAKISTVKSPAEYNHSHYLPYGFVQSPLLASICLFESALGQYLDLVYNKNNDIEVSVYMDDIVISSRNKLELENVYEQIISLAYKSKFALSDSKTLPVSTETQAFNIIISENNLSIEDTRFQIFKEVYSTSQSEPQRNGIGSYVGSVNKKQAQKLDVA